MLSWRHVRGLTWCMESSSSSTRCGLVPSRINSIHAAHTTLVKSSLPGDDWIARRRLWSVSGIHYDLRVDRNSWVFVAVNQTRRRACWLCTECRLPRTTQARAYNCTDLPIPRDYLACCQSVECSSRTVPQRPWGADPGSVNVSLFLSTGYSPWLADCGPKWYLCWSRKPWLWSLHWRGEWSDCYWECYMSAMLILMYCYFLLYFRF